MVSSSRAWRLARTAALGVAVAAGTAALVATPRADGALQAGAGRDEVGLETVLPSAPGTADAPGPPRRAGRPGPGEVTLRASRGTPPRRVRDGRTVSQWRFGRAGMLWPVPGEKTTGGTGWRTHPVYGYRSCHTGLDIAGTWGTPVLAAEPGVVTLVKDDGPFGKHTVVRGPGGLSFMYAHQETQRVRKGDRVSRGQVIGTIGSTGWVTGPHLHFEVHRDGMPYDPLAWFLPSHRMAPVVCAHRMPY